MTSIASTTSSQFNQLPEIFALIIGISEYASPEVRNLKFAAQDADKFEKFLLNNLNVPHSHIINLRNEAATRFAIINAFTTLLNDARIVKEDDPAIIIYFAGHGASMDKPEEWDDWVSNTGKIELLSSADINIVKITDSGEEQVVPGIPDRTISVLLNHLSDAKGNNVTLVLDCCCSGGLSRTEFESSDPRHELTPRQIWNLPPIDPNVDREILHHGIRYGGISQGFSGKFHGSHVLLAACGREQVAYEDPHKDPPGGLFTRSLLKILTSSAVHNLTYTAVMHSLSMPLWQTPHYEGQHINRRLFNKRALGADSSFISGERIKDEHGRPSDLHFSMHAGAAQGVVVGSVYEIYNSNLISSLEHPNPSVGRLVVSKVDAVSSELSRVPRAANFRVLRLFYCRLGTPAAVKLTLYCDRKAWLETVFPSDERERFSVVLVDHANAAALCLYLVNSKVHFTRNDALIDPYIPSRLPHVVDRSDVARIQRVIKCAIHFNYHLTRSGPGDSRNVYMELRRLRIEYSAEFGPALIPFGKNLIEKEPASLVVDEHADLGMTIYNRTNLTLYPYLFYFDPSDLEIIEWYSSPAGAGLGNRTNAVDAPLPPRSQLTIGFGNGGGHPWRFLLRDNEDVDVGFFKLFLTTLPADFASITQGSPFEVDENIPGHRIVPIEGERSAPHKWGSQLLTVVQRRAKTSTNHY